MYTRRNNQGGSHEWPISVGVFFSVLALGALAVGVAGGEEPRMKSAAQSAPVVEAPTRLRLVVGARGIERPSGDNAEQPARAIAVDEKKGGNHPPTGTGMHLYPPPGTKPPKPGIVVPEGFALPPGYMRHYQTTDDGQPLRAIVVFHPDYDVVDEQGNPVAIPEDRVVSPELAPPGLPVEILEVPTVTYPTPPAKDPKKLSGEEAVKR